jgi:dipeptidyl aminopeptidase/acylaminoacyl peptidase
MSRKQYSILGLIIFLLACKIAAPASSPALEISYATAPTGTDVASPSFTPTATSPPTLTPTPDPYTGLRIEELAARTYGGGELPSPEVLSTNSFFTRSLISYPGDGLTINGFMDVPYGSGPFPVLILLHGYVPVEGYQVETYTARYAADFARAGYIVIHPNYRNYPPSDSGPNLFRVGYAVDVLNLVAIVTEMAGETGPLEAADGANIFLWGHSMGGGIAQRVLTAGAPINGAVLYGSMSGDERQNFEHIRDVLSDGDRGLEELAVPEEVLLDISPAHFYDRVSVPVSIHHGDIDEVVPLQWSSDLCQQLIEHGKDVECFTYHNMPHTFYGDNDQLLIQRSLDFFERYTK